MVNTDKHAGIALVMPTGEGLIYQYSGTKAGAGNSEAVFSILSWVKSPLAFVVLAGVVYWQVG